MKDRFYNMIHFLYITIVFFVGTSYSADLKCGFPGTPMYGFVSPNEAAYEEGAIVMYSCLVGHILLGSSISRCKGDGTWSEEVPVCDDSMTTLVTASSTPTAPGYPAELAIDKNKERCTYLQPKSPRWWRIDLGDNKEYKVLSVAITVMNTDKHVKFSVFVIQIQNQIASYKRCASFSGKFGTQTMVLLCAEGKGIDGHRVHIEDYDKDDKGYFEICEVEIQVKKDEGYKCGAPSRSLYSVETYRNDDMVRYGCLRGYKLSGKVRRECTEESGQWSGEPPICIPIVCDPLEPIENGVSNMEHGNQGVPLEGAQVLYNCNYGYMLVGNADRTCEGDGSWRGKPPKCKIITCPAEIPYDVGGKWRYQTTRVGSNATLRCSNDKYDGENLQIVCKNDGKWSEPQAKCLIPIALAKKEITPRIVNQGGVIFGMVVAAIMIVVVLVGVYLYDQRRRNNKPELPSRFQEPPLPPPRPPPRAKENAFKSAFKGFLNRDNPDSSKSSWKTQSLPSNQAPADETESMLNSKKAFSYGESLPSGENEESPALVEVEVLPPQPPHRSGRKGVITPVPEESENTTVDDIVIEMDEADSNKDSSAKDNVSDYAAVDYEKKRQSRLLKEQDSLESASPLPLDDSDKKEPSRSSTPANNLKESDEEEEEEEESEDSQHTESQKEREEQERKAKEEEERKAKEEEERKAKEEAERKAKEEEEKKEEARSRRRRTRDEPPPVVEERPVLRRVRKY
ncbi:uncharacterized protein [Parasteatoda tepidariorum]|uniref:uncharacterized protein n=1 Tax=Parasteatoda tepidariorum TaxID=114398 RepID=UPI00077FC078|nr:sushi, von Willebrand factor type A, EGF and pentraxin domain-containing protein 1-like [Parasteatoda tepidariorum]